MLQMIGAIGGGLFVLASLLVGGRLMWLARTTRGLPEFVLGAALFTMGGIGYPMLIVAIQATGMDPGLRMALLAVQMLVSAGGMTGVAWFTRHVFRRSDAWATWLFAALVAAYAGLALWQIMGPGLLAFLAAPSESPWNLQTYLGIAVMTWAGVEAIHYWRLLQKRIALGLADPVVADRFRLWGTGILTADTISFITVVGGWLGIDMVGTAAGSVAVGFLGLVAAAMLWLAFVPPASYLERVRARASA